MRGSTQSWFQIPWAAWPAMWQRSVLTRRRRRPSGVVWAVVWVWAVVRPASGSTAFCSQSPQCVCFRAGRKLQGLPTTRQSDPHGHHPIRSAISTAIDTMNEASQREEELFAAALALPAAEHAIYLNASAAGTPGFSRGWRRSCARTGRSATFWRRQRFRALSGISRLCRQTMPTAPGSALQVAAEDRRGRLWRRLHGRAGGTDSPPHRPQGHPARDGYQRR